MNLKNFIRWGLLSAVLSIGFLLLLYLTDKTWMVKAGRISSYIIFFMMMMKGVSPENSEGFAPIFKESWLIFVVGSTLFHLALYVFMNQVDPELQIIAQNLAQSWLENDTPIPLDDEKISVFREITFPMVASYIFPGTIWAGIISVIKKKDSFID